MHRLVLYASILFWFTSALAAPGFWPVPAAFPGGSAALDATVHVFLFSDEDAYVLDAEYSRKVGPGMLARLTDTERSCRQLEFDNPGPNGRVFGADLICHASGVVVSGGRTVITAANIFSQSRHAKVMILDHRGRVILDTRFEPERVRVSHLTTSVQGTDHPLASLPALEMSIATNAVILTTADPLPVSPLQTFANVPPPGSEVALISYPEATNDRVEFGRPDSEGAQARLSIGKLTAVHPEYAKSLRRVLPDEEQRRLFVAAKVFADVDLVNGSGGGPLFNKKGVMIGIMNTRLNYGAQSAYDYAPAGGHGVSAQTILEIAGLPGCEFEFL